MEESILPENIVPFIPRQRRRRSKLYVVPPLAPTQLEQIGEQIGNRYKAYIENIRRESLKNLSKAPYNAWGISEKKKK